MEMHNTCTSAQFLNDFKCINKHCIFKLVQGILGSKYNQKKSMFNGIVEKCYITKSVRKW